MITNLKAGKKIAEKREAKGLTQEAMAAKVGISLRQYNKYENGSFPKYKSDSIKEIDKILGTEIQELLYEHNVHLGSGNAADTVRNEIIIAGDLEKILSRHEERIIQAEAKATVLTVTLAELLAKINGKSIGSISVELSKAIDAEADRLFDELSKKRG